LNNELEEVFRRWYPRFALKLRDPDFLTHSSLRDNDTKVRKVLTVSTIEDAGPSQVGNCDSLEKVQIRCHKPRL
jgi:hypothetical protein